MEEEITNEIVSEAKVEPKKKEKRHRKHFSEITPENDIKYRGPLSYRHLRILGWLFLSIGQVGLILNMSKTLNFNQNLYGVWPKILDVFGSLMAPLFLIAAFSVVLVAKNGYRRLITLYVGLNVLMYVGFLIVYQHYLVGLFTAFNPSEGQSVSEQIVGYFSKHGFIAFNVFIDLLLCALMTFFINYNPTKFFQDKKIIIFRLLAIVPCLYEIGSIVLKMLAVNSILKLSPFIFPLLTTKSPLSFIIFVIMALFIKNREKIFIKKGKTHEDFLAFQNTNANSLHFSICLSITIVIVVIVDLIVSLIITSIFFSRIPITEGMDATNVFIEEFSKVYSTGFGQTLPLLLIIPIILLFNYRKTYEDKLPDIIIPAVGIVLLIIVTFEGGFEVIRKFIIDMRSGVEESESEEAESINFLKNVVHLIKK